jgi:hypothetical protein
VYFDDDALRMWTESGEMPPLMLIEIVDVDPEVYPRLADALTTKLAWEEAANLDNRLAEDGRRTKLVRHAVWPDAPRHTAEATFEIEDASGRRSMELKLRVMIGNDQVHYFEFKAESARFAQLVGSVRQMIASAQYEGASQ